MTTRHGHLSRTLALRNAHIALDCCRHPKERDIASGFLA